MPDFTLRHPDSGDTFVTGDPAERARLAANGYVDITGETTAQPEPPSTPPTTPEHGPF